MPFDASRRLIGPNLFFASGGAVLELEGVAADERLIAGWSERVLRARRHLGWTLPGVVARTHSGGGATLALAAPDDQLYTATEVNEWALCATLAAWEPERWQGLEAALAAAAFEEARDPQQFIPPVLAEQGALARLTHLARAEARPQLIALLSAARERHLPHVLDDETLTLGAGAYSRDFALESLPDVRAVPWSDLLGMPIAVVTGSNGKTTSVRLIAACLRAHGLCCAFNCTDGVFVGEEMLEGGDYSGPTGAWRVLREPRATAAVIEAARGGILRRGLAVRQAQVALVTNISADHFGEYGIDDLDGLADVKLTVAAAVVPDGLLVLNADDTTLVGRLPTLAARFGRTPAIGWFALDADRPSLAAHRARGGATCGVRGGRLMLDHAGTAHDLGAVTSLPLTIDGSATYNIANLAGAALAAAALGVPAATIASVFARFGTRARDNAGRMMRFTLNGAQVLLDYAHNPEGLSGLLQVAEHLRAGRGRLGLILGHAGNRRDREIVELARVAAEFRPALVVVKENEAHLRGRAPGEIPQLIRAELLNAGLPESAVPMRASELEAARCALAWARTGDVLALPVHSAAARAAVLELLEGPSLPGAAV